jgi:hypothetical protein
MNRTKPPIFVTLNSTASGYYFDRLPEDIRALLQKYPNQIALAGGFLRDMECHEEKSAKDIDLFMRDGLNPEYVKMDIPHSDLFTSNDALTLNRVGKPDIQLVHRYNDGRPIVDLLDCFDFTCCRSALWHTGEVAVCTRDIQFSDDCQSRVLRYRGGDNPGSSLSRVIKLSKRGWNITHEELAKVVGHLVREAGLMDPGVGYTNEGVANIIANHITPENY